ncbi:hypothetical protein M422DRAFT_53496 [Sphaerobolus stellatus SS14]|uniref:Unplaced genomic scaffold SPHSTscaffold_171, whole genome shotgun sequence n=1 Tax=Sphaerobolus stellatus (strain SS14) TaxID=990650 RepID=A0A0C9U9L5_SPHS4|nr:hypothetical protein M422DRAFT_53496 [Sphaerobolus stellatus SS14]
MPPILSRVRKQLQKASNRPGTLLTDPQAVKSVKVIYGREVAWEEFPEELSTASTSAVPARRPIRPIPNSSGDPAWLFDVEATHADFEGGSHEDGHGSGDEDDGNADPEPVSTLLS